MEKKHHPGAAATKNHNLIPWLNLAMEGVWLAMLFLLPLVFFPNIFTTFELAKLVVFQGAALLLFLLWCLKYLLNRSSPSVDWTPARKIFGFLGIFLGCYVLATVFSVAPALSVFGWYPRFQGIITLVWYVVFGMVIFFELKTSRQRERLMFTLLGGFVFACVIALMQKFVPDFLQWWNDTEFNGRIYGTLANPNYLASYAAMIIPLTVVNIFRNKLRIFSVLCLIAGMLTLGLTLSRAGFLAVSLSLLFLFGIFAYRKGAKKTLVVLGLLPFIAAALVWFVMANQQQAWVQNIPLLNRLTANETNLSSTRSRLEIWQGTMRQILVSPVVGFGPETFAVTFSAFAPPDVNTREDAGEIADHAHNELLDFAVQIGIPGMVAYLCFLLGLVVAGAKEFLLKGKTGDREWVMLGLATGVLALFIANEFGFSVTVHWVLLVLFAAMFLNMMLEKHFRSIPFEKDKAAGIFRWVMFLAAAGLSIGMYWIHDVRLAQADIFMRQAYDGILSANLGNGNAADIQASDQYAHAAVLQISDGFQNAVRFAPNEAFYALNLAHFVLDRLYDGQKLSSVETLAAYGSALHAARLRGYDSFALSVAQELKKFLGD